MEHYVGGHSVGGGIVLVLFILLVGSLFSCLETATVAISEHRLKSLQIKYTWAKYAYKLKSSLNQILIFSLFGNSLANTAFTTIATFFITSILPPSDSHLILPITTLIIALFIIIFSEALPKILAARYPIAILKFVSIPAYYIFIISKPIIWTIDKLIAFITMLFEFKDAEIASLDEIKEIIADKRSPFKDKHRSILLNSMAIENLLVKEVLIPLRMVEGVNIKDNPETIYQKIRTTHHTRIIVYDGMIDNIVGFIHVRDVLSINQDQETILNLTQRIKPIAFVNDFTPIVKQIHRAQKNRERIFVAINEYGDISGIICLEDMLEMIFGDFTTESVQQKYLVIQNEHNQLIVDGTMLIRELNELYHLNITLNQNALTINGLVQYVLGGIPNVGVCFKLNNLIFEIINVGDYWVERVTISKLNDK